eukprot:GHVT01020900.1.p1 GENE.GHVT01020900.1~~GHVT01020900.1.p1  ORF type:complete len:205 (-),score=22.97 GHVT01020900.1:673-1287(-)
MCFSLQVVYIDARGHLLGRLASVAAKELLKGQKLVVLRCEDINISGSLYRNKLKYQRFLRLRMNTNPRRGPFHLRAPSKILWRVVRGMMPHKTKRGAAALARMTSVEGVPCHYERKKKVVVPAALRVLRLKTHRDYCRLGDISSKVGWNKDGLIKRLEAKRHLRGASNYAKVSAANKATTQAKKDALKMLSARDNEVLKMTGFA